MKYLSFFSGITLAAASLSAWAADEVPGPIQPQGLADAYMVCYVDTPAYDVPEPYCSATIQNNPYGNKAYIMFQIVGIDWEANYYTHQYTVTYTTGKGCSIAQTTAMDGPICGVFVAANVEVVKGAVITDTYTGQTKTVSAAGYWDRGS